MMTTVFRCEDDPDAIFTAIYDAWASRLGHENVRVALNEADTLELFCQYVDVTADPEKSGKVIRSIRQKISPLAWRMVFRAAMSCYETKADDIYRFLIVGFRYGRSVTQRLTDPAVMRMTEINRSVGNESHYYREFLRFEEADHRILIGRIRPKHNILTMLTPHFADRISGENFLILDVGRDLAAVHPAHQNWYLTTLTREEAEQLIAGRRDDYRDLWQTFYDTIAIKERENRDLKRNRMPIRYREFMPETD